nr:integrase, catalytic region, zinc finger, CCHC-type, peptidase aspartic, catalytic [Tanacetum cinerariifolium]
MTTLADKAILLGADNRPPMLEKDVYDSWKSRTELYMMNRQHRRMILESVENGPLLWPTIEENGVTRPKKYSELSATKAIQADFDVKATNIILQGLPPEVYALGESLRDFYLRFSLLLNDMNIYNMKLEQFQVNTKVLSTLPPEWSKFMTDVKLVRDLHTTNVDQLHAYLGQHKFHANENFVNSEEPNISTRPTQVEVPKGLPKVSMVNSSLKKLKYHLASFDVVVKERTIATAITESTWGFEHTKACFRDEIIPFVKALKDLFNFFDQFLIDDLSKVQNVFNQMEQAVEQHPQSQEKDTVIMKLKKRIKSFNGNLKEEKIKQELEEIETINIELDHWVTKLVTENEHLKQTYKQLYDSIKSSRVRSKEQCDDLIKQVNIKSAENSDLNASLQEKVLVITALKDTLRKLKGKHTQEETATLREIVENERLLNPLNTSLDYAYSRCSKYMTGDRSQLTNFVNKFLGTVKFGNDHVAKIMGYGDYKIRNVIISRVNFVEGLGHNLFFVGHFCDSDLEVAFCQHTCFIRNLEGVDLLTGSRGNNLYTLSLGDMMASSPICILSKASKTKSWLWHRRLSHLNFGAINHLARQSLFRGLPKLKFKKDHLCSACAMGKRSSLVMHQQKKAFRIYNRRTRKTVETIHVDFDELTTKASEQSSLGPALHEMIPATISSGLVPKPTSSTTFVPPSRNEWDLLFQPLFDELLTPSPSVEPSAPEVIALIADIIPLE